MYSSTSSLQEVQDVTAQYITSFTDESLSSIENSFDGLRIFRNENILNPGILVDEHNLKNFNNQLPQCTLLDLDSQPLLNQRTLTRTSTESNKENNPGYSRSENYIYQILMETGEGEFLINCYDYEKKPGNYQKLIENKHNSYFSISKVARIVIHHEIRRTRSYTINGDRLEVLAKSVAQLFPDKLQASFYSRSSADSNAHGVFQTFYTKLREKALAIDLIQRSKKRKSPDNEVEFSDEFIELQKPVQIIDESYVRKWDSTAKEEKINFFKNCDTETAFNLLPNLAHPAGYTLVQADFCSFFDKEANLFNKNWPGVASKIIKLAKTKKADKEIKEILQKNLSSTNYENSLILPLMLLPYLFKKITKQTVRSKTGKSWNPEKAEVLSSFILHVTDTENVQDALKTAQTCIEKIHTDHKLTVQPYVAITGASLSEITASYVILGKFKYQVSSPTLAVDICFQCLKVFHERPSHMCSHVWQFLEYEVFHFEVPNLCSAVTGLIEKLRKI